MFTKRQKTGKSERGFRLSGAVEYRFEEMLFDMWHLRFVIGHLKQRYAAGSIDGGPKLPNEKSQMPNVKYYLFYSTLDRTARHEASRGFAHFFSVL